MRNLYLSICRCLFVFILFLITNYTFSQNVRINEFMALNASIIFDEDKEYSDWIEIYNSGASAVNMKDWALTDDKDLPFKWLFPNITLNAGGYLVVFASGKDKTTAGSELHTNFKLSGSGEYLALFNNAGIAVTEFTPAYPSQQNNYSFGFYEGNYVEFNDPTPGKNNDSSSGTVIPSPTFNVERGFFNTPFNLILSSPLNGVKIYFTRDGSAPGKNNGTLYTTPINISTTSIIRAVAMTDGANPSATITNTYLFADDVIRQNNTPAGYPDMWGPYSTIQGNAIADYEMDAELMADTDFENSCREALLDIPTVSLVSDIGNFFSHSTDPNEGGIYIYTGSPAGDPIGRGWERPVSFEFFDSKSSTSVQANCCMKLHGGHGRVPEKTPKHSFVLEFKSEYGTSKLDHPFFGEDGSGDNNKLIIGAGFCNSWTHHDSGQRTIAQSMRDFWSKDTQRDMGHLAGKGIYAHLYINGIYWGLYKPMERMDADYAAKHMGGDPEDWDVIKDKIEVPDGNDIAWKKLLKMADSGLNTNENYQKVQGNNPDGRSNPEIESLVDVVNLADYMLLNFFGANSDWDHHNWAVMRNRVKPGKGFQFLCWDAEHMVKGINDNNLGENNDGCPSRIFQKLLENEEFKRLFADRIQKHCYNNGALTPEANIARWINRRDQIEKAIYAESARWGDYRRDVHPYQTKGPFDLYTVEDYWLPQQDYMLNSYFPQRTDVFLSRLRKEKLFPNIDAPIFAIDNKPIIEKFVAQGDKLSMTASKGSIYYTLNGKDPVEWQVNGSGKISEEAIVYSKPVSIENSAHVIARAFYNGEWSALIDRFLCIPSNFYDLKITEIHYNPINVDTIDGDQFEFVEIKNTGSSTIHLGGLQFIDGIKFEFPDESQLRPHEFIVLTSNNLNFYRRYGFSAFGEYKGNLDNNGEWLVFTTTTNDTIISLRYNDGGEWPALADGDGYSLVPILNDPTGEQINPKDWRASYSIGGSPGSDDISPVVVDDEDDDVSSELINSKNNVLARCYPNPFSEITYIDYQIPGDAFVQLSIFNIAGEQIACLVNGNLNEGLYQAAWNGTNYQNNKVPNGIYFYRLSVNRSNKHYVKTNKLMLMR